jgi:hypothetical protein
MLHMFQWRYTYVASVYSKCFPSVSDVCCKCFIWMLHMMQLIYTCVASVCCKMFHLFQTYVVKALHVATLAGAGSGCRRRRSPRVCQAKWAWVVPTCMRINKHETHNCMCRRTSMWGWGRMCRHSSMWGRMCRHSSCLRRWTCMRCKLTSMHDRRDGHGCSDRG